MPRRERIRNEERRRDFRFSAAVFESHLTTRQEYSCDPRLRDRPTGSISSARGASALRKKLGSKGTPAGVIFMPVSRAAACDQTSRSRHQPLQLFVPIKDNDQRRIIHRV